MLNKDFMPAYVWVKEFMKEADEPFTIAVERENGIVENYETKINTNDTEKSKFYIERTVKTLLWFYGGFKIYLSGQNDICEYIKQCYSKGVGLNMITYLGALQNVPTELDEAAKIDGCNHFTIYARIITPLAKPSIATMILFSFVWTWNDYMSPYLYISDINKQMLSVGIKLFSAGQVQDYGSQMAAATLVLLPIIVVFLFCQSFFIENAISSGVKG